jgi:hypothetical protein
MNFKNQYNHYNNASCLIENFKKKYNQEGLHFCNLPNNFNFLYKINSDKVVVFCFIDVIPVLEYWQTASQMAQQTNKNIFVITDSLIEFPSINNIKFINKKEFFGLAPLLTDEQYPLTIFQPKKLFECTISRVESVRCSWFYFLHLYNLIDQGYVCFLFNQLNTYSSLQGQQLLDYIHKKHGLDQLPHFDQAYQELRDCVPYCNFVNGTDINKLVMHSKYSLCLETYATEDNSQRWIVYEKTFRALQTPTYPLIFAQQGAIAKFKNLGFIIPEGLDNIDNLNWVARQQSLLEILKNDSESEPWAVSQDRARHNRQLLYSWNQQIQQTNFFDNIIEQVI